MRKCSKVGHLILVDARATAPLTPNLEPCGAPMDVHPTYTVEVVLIYIVPGSSHEHNVNVHLQASLPCYSRPFTG
jgi:hypothetical protein